MNRLYYPDFILDDGTYVEVKGYMTKAVSLKLAAVPHFIKLLRKGDLKKHFAYVRAAYKVGSIEEIYDKVQKPRLVLSCSSCGEDFEKKRRNATYCSRQCAGRGAQKVMLAHRVKNIDSQCVL